MNKLTTVSFLFSLFCLSSLAHAGIAGWVTARTVDWEFIQKTGGLRVHDPILREGRVLLPIEYDPSGTITVTQKPTLVNSGLMVRKIKAKWKGQLLMLEVVVSVIEKDARPARMHYIEIKSSWRKTFPVAYGILSNQAVHLGEFESPTTTSALPESAP